MKAGRRTVFLLGVYAAAMGFVEAAVVVYLRRIHYPDDPLSLFPLRAWPTPDLLVEIAREAATLVMILSVALIVAADKTRRAAAFLYVFGLWDLCYYAWLKIALGWPVSWSEWDILFLIPWPWLAPWLAPAVIALLVAIWGAGVLLSATETIVPGGARRVAAAGLLLVLASFLEPALPLLGGGHDGTALPLPRRFLWELYLPGVTLLAWASYAGRAGSGAQTHRSEGRASSLLDP